MGRSLPILAEQAKDSAGQRTFWLMDIELKASGSYAAENLYISTQAVYHNGHHYEPRLKGKPQIRHTLGAASDAGQPKIDNTDLEIGQKILPRERFIEGSKVTIHFAWKLNDGTILADPVFIGEIGGANLSTSDAGVTLNLIGDVYRPTSVLGAFPLAQRCVYKFNAFGLLSPDESNCGWQVEQGGNPESCDHTEDGPNGCNAHFNIWRIGAIPFFANVVVQIVSAVGIGSSGFPSVGPRKPPAEIEPIYSGVY